MDRLSLVLILLTEPVLVGGLIIVVLSLGLYGWLPIAAAVVVGIILTWPVAYAISRWIKHDDPGWTPRSGAQEYGRESRTDYPET